MRARQLARRGRHPERQVREPLVLPPYRDREHPVLDGVEMSLHDQLRPEPVQVAAVDAARMRTRTHDELRAAADDADAARALDTFDPTGEELGALPQLAIDRPIE